VTYEGKPVHNVNELEWVKGRIYANVWQTNMMILIDPASGEITGVVNLAGLVEPLRAVGGGGTASSTGLPTMPRTTACS